MNGLSFESHSTHPYQGKRIVLTSKHKKLGLIKPTLEQHIGCEIFEKNLDTDLLGTFSREIERTASPRETAIRKARFGMKASGARVGIASEGSIGPDPSLPFVHSDIEYLVLVDDENEIVIAETFRSFDIVAATITCVADQDLSEFLMRADFPHHALIVSPNAAGKSRYIKGIQDRESLDKAISECAEFSLDGSVIIESDLRAMYSPSRQKNIEQAAKLLALRVSNLCPECQMPGWGRIGFEKGLHCSDCGQHSADALRAEVLGCVKCQHQQIGKVLAQEIEPAQCLFCNP